MMIYKDLRASVFKFLQAFAAAAPGNGLVALEVVNLDAHADLTSLPANPIIGVRDLEYVDEHRTLEVAFRIGVSTYDDTNLFDLTDVVDRLAFDLRPDQTIPFVSAATGAQYGLLKIKPGVLVQAPTASKLRPAQFIALTAGSDIGGP